MAPIISRKFQRLISPLGADELAQLEANILADGCRDPLVTWKHTLLDGHNRLDICERHNLPFKTVEVFLIDELDAEIWIRMNQGGRRNLTDDQRACNADALAEKLGERAKRDRAGTANDVRYGRKTSLGADAVAKDKSRKKAAKVNRVSERKVRQAKFVRAHDPKLLDRVIAGELTLADATREIKKRIQLGKLEDIATKEAKAIAGHYDVIVIDPPWPMEKIDRDERPNQSAFEYPTMAEAQLAALKLPAADSSHVWLWTTQRFLPMAFRLFETWGVNYVCSFVWHKPGGFQPIGLPQFNCEFALYGRVGSPAFVDTKAFPVCFEAPRGKHSEKPEEFYDVVRRVTAGRRIDMFNRRAIAGFDGWGNEAQ